MSLDDRSLREHLDRRATAGLTNPDELADAVISRLPSDTRVGWWRRFARGTRSLGLAAAAVVAIVVALAVLPSRLMPGPGTSSTPSDIAQDPYPADRPLTLAELNWYLGPGPQERAGSVVVADVELASRAIVCDQLDCADLEVVFADRTISVHNIEGPDLGGPYALRVRPDGALELLASVQTASTGLAWSLPDYLDGLADLLATDRLAPRAYIVEATAASMLAPSCPTTSETTGSAFDVGCGPAAWLFPLGTDLPTDGQFTTPADGLRIQNGGPDGSTEGVGIDGFFLVLPLGVDSCFMCVQGQTSQYLATLTPIELPLPAPTDASLPPAADYPNDRALTLPEVADIVAEFTGDGRHLVIVAELDMVEIDRGGQTCLGDYSCPTWEIAVSGSAPIPVWATAGFEPNPEGPDAFNLVEDLGPDGPGLNFLGPVGTGPNGLAWTLSELLSELPSLTPDGDFPYLYLVEADRVSTPNPSPCPSIAPQPEPTFDCRTDLAWLAPEGSSIDETNGPETGIRVPGAAYMLDSTERRQGGFWLIDPIRTPPICVACPPAGAAAMIGRAASLAELGLTAPEPSPPGPSPIIGTRELGVIDITLPSSVVLDGWAVADVELSVTFAGDIVEMGQMDMSMTPLACLEADEPASSSAYAQLVDNLERVPGTNTWIGTFRFTSSQAGIWHVTCLQAYDAAGNRLVDDLVGVDPFALGVSPTLVVEGTHRPGLTMSFEPSPAVVGQPLEVSGFVTDENGTPYPGVGVTIGRDNVCAEGGAGETVTTDATGRYSYVIPVADPYAVCAWLLEIPGVFPQVFFDPEPNAIYGLVFDHPTEP